MLWRIIFLGLLVWLAIVVLKRVFKRPNSTTSDSPKTKPNSDTEDMVQCAHCAVHLPRSEAYLINGKMYCCKNHIQAHE